MRLLPVAIGLTLGVSLQACHSPPDATSAPSDPVAAAAAIKPLAAKVVAFNYLQQHGAFTRDAGGHYKVDFDQMAAAVNGLSARILTLQGDGDYAGAKYVFTGYG